MKLSYDFHIHTVASPCAHENMTPNNIINMAHLLEKQMIAITDHNTCANCEVAMQIGKRSGIVVIPGMEIECMEEFHTIALFPSLEAAKHIEEEVQKHMPNIKNQTHIFGHQWLLDEKDEVVGEIERMLLTAAALSIYDLVPLIRTCGGIIYPAHIDRASYSILSNLGTVPKDLGFTALELSKDGDLDYYKKLFEGYKWIRSSDAHYLEDLCKAQQFIELECLSKTYLFDWFMKQ